MASMETKAHLDLLMARGQVIRDDVDGVFVFSLVEGASDQ